MATFVTPLTFSNEQPVRALLNAFVPQPAFATMEEVRYAHELRLQLRARLLHEPAPSAEPWSVGVD